jgi:predicted O-methyltransferase YrrM
MSFLLLNSASSVKNVVRNMFRAGYFPEMLRKVFIRLREKDRLQAHEQSTQWCRQNETDAAVWASAQNPELWNEAESLQIEQAELARRTLEPLGFFLAGGGFYALLHFLVRLYKPEYLLETGVAAGHSSRAMLLAIKANGKGHLWSSDFPLFRLEDPEKYVGILVEQELRSNWTVLTKGDRVNLPELINQMPRIDFFHFDSDKSLDGRKFVTRMIGPKLHQGSIVMFDDVQDNLHFRDNFAKPGVDWRVFGFGSKWIGIALPQAGQPRR